MKISIFLNVLNLLYLILINLLLIKGHLSFGEGMGDWYLFILLSFITLTYGLAIVLISFKFKDAVGFKFNYLLFAVFLLISIYVSYEITIGRGLERSWDGNIFVY